MEELTRILLSQAIDRRASAVRWAVLLTIAAIFVHVFTFAPYVETSLQKRDTDAHLNAVNGVKGDVDAMAPGLQAALGELEQQGRRLGDDLRQSLLQDFARLEASRRQTLMGHSNAAGPNPPLPPNPPFPPVQAPLPDPSPMIQMPLALAAAPPAPFDIADPAFRDALLANDREHLLRELSPFVGRLIVEPRYRSVNEQWSHSIVPALILAIDKVASQSATLASGHAEFAADIDRFKTSLDETRQQIVGMRFVPPAADRWWATALGKGAAGAEISANVLAFQEPLVQQLHTLAGSIAAVADAQKALSADYAARLDAIRKDFAEQISQLSSLSEPLGVFRLELSRFVPVAPLMIGLLVGALMLWHGVTEWRLAALLEWCRSHGQIDDAYVALLRGSTHLPGATSQATGAQAVIVSSIIAVAGVVWVLIAGFQSAALEGWHEIWPQTAFGIAAVLGGALYMGFCRRPDREAGRGL